MLDMVVVEKYDAEYRVERVCNDDDWLVSMHKWLEPEQVQKKLVEVVRAAMVVVERRALDRRRTYNLVMVVVVEPMKQENEERMDR